MASKTPTPPAAALTKDRIRAASVHLKYEVQAMRRTREHLKDLGTPSSGMTEDKRRDINAYLESFTVHVRALTDFLYPKVTARPTDVQAQHYCSNWPSICGTIPPLLDDARERVGREIVHLTYRRLDVTPAQKQWFLDHVSQPLEEKLEHFARHADSQLLDPEAMAVLLGKIQ
jgi:hypothetical protein